MNMQFKPERNASQLVFEGAGKSSDTQAKSRIFLSIILLGFAYIVIVGRLFMLGLVEPGEASAGLRPDISITAKRPDIRDRNGETLATDLVTSSLFAEPNKIIDVDEAVEKLQSVLPDLDFKTVHRRLSSKAGFVWLKRELTPAKESQILGLGLPGVGFRKETRRFYPNGETASHLVGHVNIDNVGIAGLEKYIDDRGLRQLRSLGFASDRDLQPVHLSIDLRVQHYVREELAEAMRRYKALAAGAIVLNANTGEVVAMASLPDYNPNKPSGALEKENFNRISNGVFEMGSTFKAFTTAMALDSGKINMNSRLDARKPLRFGRHTINDFHAKRRILSVPEVFIYSSNIGTVKMADAVGVEGHRKFLHKIGILSQVPFELPETASPNEPKKWSKISSATISYGHGASTTPLQTAVAGAALVNGGKLINPTLFPRSRAQADQEAVQVISEKTSKNMRTLMRMNVEQGSGKRAEVPGFSVGGKTGTAEKVVNGRYSKDVRFNAFLGAFPTKNPEYVVLAFIDEPKPEKGQKSATAGLNAAPVVGNIIRRSASVLGVQADFGNVTNPLLIAD